MVIEIDPEDTLDDDLLVTRRIPEEGRLALEVHSMPDFELTFDPLPLGGGSRLLGPGGDRGDGG